MPTSAGCVPPVVFIQHGQRHLVSVWAWTPTELQVYESRDSELHPLQLSSTRVLKTYVLIGSAVDWAGWLS